MDTNIFRKDLIALLESGVSQIHLSELSGVSQPVISKFVAGKTKGMNMNIASKLWPFVYGTTPATPTSTPETCEARHGG